MVVFLQRYSKPQRCQVYVRSAQTATQKNSVKPFGINYRGALHSCTCVQKMEMENSVINLR